MSNYISIINIPAYDASGNGLIVKLKLSVIPNSPFHIDASGTVATALKRNFRRTIEIMSSLKRSWECLESNAYLLDCNNENYVVKDAKSSSMALSIALINVCRAIRGKTQVLGLTGTGILRVDGSFDEAHLEENKHLAAKQTITALTQFITPLKCNHLFDLDNLINEVHYTGDNHES